ncbi:hypothetical protein ACFXTH_040807 [Malus domestica]
MERNMAAEGSPWSRFAPEPAACALDTRQLFSVDVLADHLSDGKIIVSYLQRRYFSDSPSPSIFFPISSKEIHRKYHILNRSQCYNMSTDPF